MLRLTENNSQPLMTKLQWLFAFLEHSQVRDGYSGAGRGGHAMSQDLPTPGKKLWIELLSPSPGRLQFIANFQAHSVS